MSQPRTSFHCLYRYVYSDFDLLICNTVTPMLRRNMLHPFSVSTWVGWDAVAHAGRKQKNRWDTRNWERRKNAVRNVQQGEYETGKNIGQVLPEILVPTYTTKRRWFRHRTTSLAGSIPDGVIGIFLWHKPSSRIMFLGSTKPLTEMSTRDISWGGKGGQWVELTTIQPPCADCHEIWEPQPPGTLRACPGL